MTDAEYISLLEENNRLLMGLLVKAIDALPAPRRRDPGDAPSAHYWPSSVTDRILADLDLSDDEA